MLDEANDVVFPRETDEVEVIVQKLDGRLRDKNVHAMFDRGLRDRVVGVYRT